MTELFLGEENLEADFVLRAPGCSCHAVIMVAFGGEDKHNMGVGRNGSVDTNKAGPMSIKKLQAIFDAKPDAELSLPARADRDRDCLECMSQRRCFKHGPPAPRAPASLNE